MVSLNSLLGNILGGSSTMRIKGTIGNQTLHILLDTGSSHNFLSDKLSKLQPSKIKDIPPCRSQ